MSNGRCLKDDPSLPQLDISDLHTFNNRFIVLMSSNIIKKRW